MSSWQRFRGLFTVTAAVRATVTVALFFCSGVGLAQNSGFQDRLFPPELIGQHQAEIRLTPAQQQKIATIMAEHGQTVTAARATADAHSKALSRLLQSETLLPAQARAELQQYLNGERDLQQAHFEALLRIRDVLSKKQRQQLNAKRRAATQPSDTSAASGSDDTEQRLRRKVEQIRAAVQARAARGESSPNVAQQMQQFSANIGNGRLVEAEAGLDRVMNMLNLNTATNAQPDAVTRSPGMLSQPPGQVDRLEASPPLTIAALRTAVAALPVEDVAWRKIDWETSLIRGLQRSRAESKPLVLWVFIDRPVDDERC